MSLFSDLKNRTIDHQYIQALKDDNIIVQEDVIDKAKQGNAEAIYNIGCVYASKENKDMAILWLGMSSALGFYESQLKLGDLFQKDSPECALTWYKLAFSNGITSAGTPIGDELLANGKYEEAKEKYIKAAEGSDPYCQNHLGEYYRDGYRVEDPYDRFILHYNTVGLHYGMALKWFQRAADQNYAKAQYNVAELYDNGWGVDKNKYTALHWYEKSRSGGYENADKCIERLNKEGYFYLPQQNSSPLATPTEAEAPESTADVKSLVDLSELKKELQALEKCDTEENLVIVNINDLMDKLASISITMTK